MTGTLYGIGLGPGDPELLTLKAHRLISNAKVVAYPTLAGQESFARSIAAQFIPADAKEIAIDIPMTTQRDPAQRAYDMAADQLGASLRNGRDVVVLCEGDPLFYGSFMYISARLSGAFAVQVVPGVTSMTACAASLNHPLCARDQSLCVFPATLAADELRQRIGLADSIAIMKVGRHLDKVRQVLTDLNLLDRAQFVAHASLPIERILPLCDVGDNAPYFSMILVNRTRDPWL